MVESNLNKEYAYSKGPTFGVRHLQFLLLFFGTLASFTMRVNISIAVVAMTTHNNETNAAHIQHEVYTWNEKTKSMILSSFFWGYLLTQIPGGQLSQMFGCKYLMLQANLVAGLLTLLIPYATRLGDWKLLCVLRTVQGLSQGVLLPSAHTLISKWAPPKERSTLITTSYQGCYVGILLMLGISGALATSRFGWPSIFYLSGSISILWSVAWFLWGASSPSSSNLISVEERLYIESSLGKVEDAELKRSKLKTPWGKILTSVPFWMLVIMHCANSWGFWTLLTQVPSYMKHVMGLNIQHNALISAMPHMAVIVLGYVFCYASNIIQKRQCLSITAMRKLFTTICTWIPMISIIAMGYVGAENVQWVVVLLIVTIGCNSASMVGWLPNHIELSPNFGGVLVGLTSSAANIMSLLAPLSVGFIINDETNPAQWRIIFFITGGFYFISNLLFLIFGTSKIQSWNEPTNKREHIEFVKVEPSPEYYMD